MENKNIYSKPSAQVKIFSNEISRLMPKPKVEKIWLRPKAQVFGNSLEGAAAMLKQQQQQQQQQQQAAQIVCSMCAEGPPLCTTLIPGHEGYSHEVITTDCVSIDAKHRQMALIGSGI